MPVPSKRALVEFLADGLSLPAGWIRTSRSAGPVESVEWGSGELVRRLCVNSGKHDRLLRNWWVEFSVPEVDRQYTQVGGFQVMLPVPELEELTREGYPALHNRGCTPLVILVRKPPVSSSERAM